MSSADGFNFELMAALAEASRKNLAEIKKLAEEHKYIRIGGDGYRPVSIHWNNPCGRLLEQGADNQQIPEVTVADPKDAASELQKVICTAKEAKPASSYQPGNEKPEHTVQAGLIHHALTNGLRLDGQNGRLQGFDEFFDELLFVSDESRLNANGKVRSDILAVGSKDGICFPVFIELKATRALTQVVGQLANALAEAMLHKESFLEMLSAATGKSDIQFERNKLLIVWPRSLSGKSNADPDTVSFSDEEMHKRHTDTQGDYLIGEFALDSDIDRKEALFKAVVKYRAV